MSALIASLFAVGAAPTAAAPIDDTGVAQVDAFPFKTACLGPALAGADFSDVSMDNAHYKAVNCIAHYGITAGRGDGSFGANDSVTRSQMALFLSGMATLAGLTLDDAMDAGFTDLGDTGDNRVSAINRLVNGGIMTPASETIVDAPENTFAPTAAVTRAEMALWLVRFMVAATDNTSDFNVVDARLLSYTGYGITPQGGTSNISVDYFADSRVSQPAHIDSAISVAFELGISSGYGDNEFKGHREVTRAEMATFITRTLAHTNVRPAGLTAQHDGRGGIQVSMRDANFKPLANEPLDLFRSYFPDYAFLDDRTCETRYVHPVAPSDIACEIDDGDTSTEADGNRNYTEDQIRDTGDAALNAVCGTVSESIVSGSASEDVVFWVWTHEDVGETVDADTELVKVEGVSLTRRPGGLAPNFAAVTGGLDPDKNELEAKMGDTVEFMLQMSSDETDDSGAKLAAASDSSGNRYTLITTVRELRAQGSGATVSTATGADALGFVSSNLGSLSVDTTTGASAHRATVSTRSNVRVGLDTDGGVGATDTYDLSMAVITRTRQVVKPDANGMLVIPVTHPDPDGSLDNKDVVVTIELEAYQVGSPLTTEDDYNPAFNKVAGFSAAAPNIKTAATSAVTVDGVTTVRVGETDGFETRVIFSDDDPNPDMFDISAKTDVYRLARGPNSAVPANVTISALDQYGAEVRGLAVNAISNQRTAAANGGTAVTAATGVSVFPLVEYFTTRSDGSYRVSYSYRGAPVIETLYAFAAVPVDYQAVEDDPDTAGAFRGVIRRDANGDPVLDANSAQIPVIEKRLPDRDTDDVRPTVLEQPNLQADSTGTGGIWNVLLPNRGDSALADKQAKVYWAYIGRDTTSPDAGYTYAPTADTGLLAWDIDDKAFIVDQAAVTGPPEVAGGPYVYYWDRHDTFTVGGTAVSMELFQTILSKFDRTADTPTLTWTSYNYNRPNDRAQWTLTCG